MAVWYQYDEEHSELENIAFALFAIASELRNLGLGSATNNKEGFGAIESFGMVLKDGMKEISDSINNISRSIDDAELSFGDKQDE